MEDKPRRYARDCVLISIIFRPPTTRVTDNREGLILLAQLSHRRAGRGSHSRAGRNAEIDHDSRRPDETGERGALGRLATMRVPPRFSQLQLCAGVEHYLDEHFFRLSDLHSAGNPRFARARAGGSNVGHGRAPCAVFKQRGRRSRRLEGRCRARRVPPHELLLSRPVFCLCCKRRAVDVRPPRGRGGDRQAAPPRCRSRRRRRIETV